MQKAIVALLVIAAVPACIHAQAPDMTYIGLYTDYDHTSWCAEGTPPYNIDVWVWLQPSERGVSSFGFNLDVPSGYDKISEVPNPIIVPEVTLPGDTTAHFMYSAVFQKCNTSSWVWTYHIQYTIPDNVPDVIEIASHPELGEFAISNCSGGIESCIRLTSAYVNYGPTSPECSYMAVRESTWGAIKSIIRG